MNWSNIPRDIFLIVLDKLAFSTVLKCSGVCKRWGDIAKESRAWDRFYIPKVMEIVRTTPYDRQAKSTYWCDYCKSYQMPEYIKFVTSEPYGEYNYDHSQCLNCFEIYCCRINKTNYCIRCLHDISKTDIGIEYHDNCATAEQLKCEKNWKKCRQNITIGDTNIKRFSCFLERCDICKMYVTDCEEISLRDDNLPMVTQRHVCSNCIASKLSECMCNRKNCICAKCTRAPYFRIPVIRNSNDKMEYEYPLCVHCINLHNENYPLPKYVKHINVELWTRYVFITSRAVQILGLHITALHRNPEDVISVLCHVYTKRDKLFGKDKFGKNKGNKFRESIFNKLNEFDQANISQEYKDDFVKIRSKFTRYFGDIDDKE